MDIIAGLFRSEQVKDASQRINTDFHCFSSQAANAARIIKCRLKPLPDPRQQLLQVLNLASGQNDETRLSGFSNRLIHIQINYVNLVEMIDFL
jgi:hypothetical protein